MASDKVTQAECFERVGDIRDKLDDMIRAQGEAKGLLTGIDKRLGDGQRTMAFNQTAIIRQGKEIVALKQNGLWGKVRWVIGLVRGRKPNGD